MGRKSGAVLYLLSMYGEYYCIDLDSMPKKISPITQFKLETCSGWTAAASEELRGQRSISDAPSVRPCINTIPLKNVTIGSVWNLTGTLEWTHREYYDLHFKTWQYMPKLDLDDGGLKVFSNYNNTTIVAHVMDDRTTLLFYEGDTFTFLFYNLVEDAWVHDDRLKNVKFFWEDGLEKMGCIHMLRQVVSHARPVVCDSTLYWFNNDMCLYGYDYSRKRWFQSNSLGHKLQWQTSQNCNQMFPTPLLFYRDNQTFVAIFANPSNKIFSLAIIRVKRNRHSGSIKVSLKSSQYIAAETEQHMIFSIVDGMTV
ncbi:hypothetical protein P3S68_008821 [Capsicum galapagoense]